MAYSRVGIDEGVPIDWSGLLGPTATASSASPAVSRSPVSALLLSAAALAVSVRGGAIGSTVDNKIQFSDNLTWQRGAHLLKIGGQAVRYRQNRYYAGNNGALGSFTFDGTVTGIAYGDFLLDQLTAKGRGVGHRQVGPSPLARRSFLPG